MPVLQDILTYAVRGKGKYVLITCVVLSVVAELVNLAPMIGFFAMLVISGYFAAIYFQLVQSSAVGDAEAPDFPDTANLFEDLMLPMLQMVGVAMVSFLPVTCYVLWTDDGSVAIMLGLLLFGIIYYPMGMLAVVVLGSILAVNPLVVIPSIFRAGWLYWLGIGMLCLLYVAGWMIEASLSGRFIIGTVVMSGISAYTLMTNARILGLIYREREEELGWV